MKELGMSRKPGLWATERGEIPGLPTINHRHLPSSRFVLPVAAVEEARIGFFEHDGKVFPAYSRLASQRAHLIRVVREGMKRRYEL